MYSDVCDTTRRNHESRTPELSFGHNFYPFDRFVLILGYVVGGSKTKRLMCAVLRESILLAYHAITLLRSLLSAFNFTQPQTLPSFCWGAISMALPQLYPDSHTAPGTRSLLDGQCVTLEPPLHPGMGSRAPLPPLLCPASRRLGAVTTLFRCFIHAMMMPSFCNTQADLAGLLRQSNSFYSLVVGAVWL
jgi:hypothetical protein